MTDSPLILVTGATGALGPSVVKAFSDSGSRVRTLSIDDHPQSLRIEAIETLQGDVTDPSVVKAAMKGVDAVVHLAALLHIVNPPEQLRNQYERINVGGTKAVVDAAIRENVRRVVLFSTIAVYGDTKGQIVSEATPPQPDTIYGQTKLDAEQVVLAARNAAGEPIGTVLRLAAVYGSRIKGNYRQLLMALEKGWFLPLGRGENRRTLIYDRDVAAAAVLALHHPAAAGRLYNVSDGQYHRLAEIIAEMCLALGRKIPRFFLPAVPVRFAVGILEDASKIVGFKPLVTRASIDTYLEDVAVNSRLIQEELGFAPRFDLKAGWQNAVQKMDLIKNRKRL